MPHERGGDVKKIFDYNAKKIPCGIIGRARELAWPCEMFRITLPKLKRVEDSDFNPLEMCVLKLLAYGRYEAETLAEETCLPLDLIELILLRLYEHEKIDEYNQLSSNARNEIEKLNTKDTTPTDYETCVIFRECIDGVLLPFIKDNDDAKPVELEDDFTLKGSIRLRELFPSQKTFPTPTVNDIISALRTMARRHKVSNDDYRIPPVEYISVIPDGPCALRVRMVIQRNSDWRILNPFGKGFTPELEPVYDNLLERNQEEANSFRQWQMKNKGERPVRQSGERDRKVEPYETEENRSSYPELLSALRRADGVYAALEWALYYALQEVPFKPIVQSLQIDTRENIVKRLSEASNDLELEVEPRLLSWLVPTEGKLQSFLEHEDAQMGVVLPLAIFAAHADSNSMFHKVAKAHPNLVPRISALKERRDIKAHGKNRMEQIYGEDDCAFMQDVVTTLLPSIIFSSSPTEKKDDKNTSADIRFDARLALQDFFGVAVFNRMDSNLQENLLRAEIFQQEHASEPTKEETTKAQETSSSSDSIAERIDALPCINALYAAAQCAFRPFLVGGEQPASATIDAAAQKAENVGFGEMPESLRTVRQDMLQRTLDGDDQTLGASVIAWLLLADNDLLQQVAKTLPSFFSDIDNLLTLRGHGNQSSMMQEKEINAHCKAIYKLINTIMEA